MTEKLAQHYVRMYQRIEASYRVHGLCIRRETVENSTNWRCFKESHWSKDNSVKH